MRELRHITALLLLVLALPAAAQQLSFDGNRWYEVEISIFTNEVPGGMRSEVPVARKLNAAYLPRLRELTSRASAYMIDFPDPFAPALPATETPPASPAQIAPLDPLATDEPELPVVEMGPIYSPAVRDSFRITDLERDPFVDLGARAAQFTQMNRRIQDAPDHRVLWNKVWRQPLQARAQTPAVFVAGGDVRGEHYELEGSLRVVANGNGAMLDINVWLNEFRAGGLVSSVAAPAEEWKIPALPFPLEMEATPVQNPAFGPAAAAPAQNWELTAVWQLAQTREMSANQLYYLDHPAIGVLIQVRPYVLPPRLPVDGSEDF